MIYWVRVDFKIMDCMLDIFYIFFNVILVCQLSIMELEKSSNYA